MFMDRTPVVMSHPLYRNHNTQPFLLSAVNAIAKFQTMSNILLKDIDPHDVIGHSYEVNYSVFIAVTLLNLKQKI